MQRTHSSAAPSAAAQSQVLPHEAEVLLYPIKQSSQPQPASVTLASPAPTFAGGDQSIRSRVFAVIGHNHTGSVNTQHLRRLMREVVTWIPDFKEFATLCTEGLHIAWLHDREAKVRTARTSRAQWIRLFRYFARHRQIDADINIRAADKAGHYACELVTRRKDDANWREFFRLGQQLGVPRVEMKRLKAQAEARAVDAHTANRQVRAKILPKPPSQGQVSHVTLASTN